jgi:hypothetical protein
MGPAGRLRPDYLWPGDVDPETRWLSPEWFDDDGQFRPPPAFAELFLPRTGDPLLTVGYDGATSAPIEDSTDDRQARTMRWEIPRIVLSDDVYERLATVTPLAAQVTSGWTVADTPRGRFQRLTPAAKKARAAFGDRLDAALAGVPVLDIRDSVDDAGTAAVEAAVTAETRDEELPAIAEELRASITPDSPGNYVVLDRSVSQLARRRDAARAGVRDRLAIVARLASGDRRERDALLRRIAAWDAGTDSYRSLGNLVGMSHTNVRAIIKEATADRDEAIDHLDATVRSLSLAWDPPGLPHVRDHEYDGDGPSDWELEQEALDGDRDRREHTSRRSCTLCGKPSTRLVRRWQAGKSAIGADDDDPARSPAGYVDDLDECPSYTFQPQWAVCGTACARKVIEADRADPGPSRVPGRTEFWYEVESFRYVPHDSELPRILRQLRAIGDLEHEREAIERAIGRRDAAGAALDLASLRRKVAQTAAVLARIRTYTPPARTFGPGTRQPGDVSQVRIGDRIYSDWSFAFPREDSWEGPGGERRTWDELTEMGDGNLTEIPRERIVIPGQEHDQDEDYDD